MGKIIDLTGQTFGKLTVLERAENTSTNNVQWLCQCECGKKTIVRGDYLRQQRTKSCGCLKKDYFTQRALEKDLTGQKFGYLTVIERTNERYKNGAVIYKCECKCGNIIKVIGNDLVQNHTQSCGCLKSKGEEKIIQILQENNIPFEVQKTFDDCRNPNTNFCFKFDFYVNNSYIIEYDGEQHFHYSKNGLGKFTEDKFKKIQFSDNFKNNYCKEHNIPLIRIPYTKYDTLCLEDLLLETTEFLINENKEE